MRQSPSPEWQDWGERPPMGTPEKSALIRMYAPDTSPRPGSLPSSELDLDGPWHFHDMHQLICAFQGALEVEIESGRHLVPRQLAAWVPAGIRHRVTLRKVPSGSIFFPVDMTPVMQGGGVRTIFVSPLMREMSREAMRWPLEGPETVQRTTFFQTLAYLTMEWIEREIDLYLPVCADPRLQSALDHVSARPDAKLADVCRHVAMSERSLRRHLKQETGMSLEAYRQRSRLLSAVALLDDSDLSISEIATQCGFESPSSFSRAFASLMQDTPSAYRGRLRSNGIAS